MKEGYLIFIRNYSWFGNRIRQLTNCEYNHVGIFIDERNIIEARFVGVEKTPLDKFLGLVIERKLDFDIYKFKNISERQLGIMLRFIKKEVGRKYDFIQMLNLGLFLFFGVKRDLEPIDNSKKWFCSELIAEGAYEAGIRFHENIDPDNITPADMLNSGLLEKVE